MHQSIPELDLAIRQDQIKDQLAVRKKLLQAAAGRKDRKEGANIADAFGLANVSARGAILRESEHSIFSDAWMLISLILLIIGFVNGRNTALISLGVVLLLIAAVSTVWKNLALMGVTYQRTIDRDHTFPGEPVTMTVTAHNAKPLPLTWLRFKDTLPVSPELDNVISQTSTEISGRYILTNTYSMHAREKVDREVILKFPKRGYYQLGPVSYTSGDIFTLFTVEREHNDLQTIIVYPQTYPLEELGLPAKEPFGDVKVRRTLFTDPIKTQGIRDYQPQDRFRDVHWKATARRGNLQTKIYEPSTGMTLAVFLNVATFPKHWMGFDPDLLERAVSVAASAASYGAEQGWGVGMYANGSVPNSDQPIRVMPGRSPNQLMHILEALAAVSEFATGSIDRMLLRESPNLPWVSTIVLVTAIVTDEMSVALIRLKEAGRRIVLVSLAINPPPNLGKIPVYHIPFGGGAATEDNLPASATVASLSSIPVPSVLSNVGESEQYPVSSEQ